MTPSSCDQLSSCCPHFYFLLQILFDDYFTLVFSVFVKFPSFAQTIKDKGSIIRNLNSSNYSFFFHQHIIGLFTNSSSPYSITQPFNCTFIHLHTPTIPQVRTSTAHQGLSRFPTAATATTIATTFSATTVSATPFWAAALATRTPWTTTPTVGATLYLRPSAPNTLPLYSTTR